MYAKNVKQIHTNSVPRPRSVIPQSTWYSQAPGSVIDGVFAVSAHFDCTRYGSSNAQPNFPMPMLYVMGKSRVCLYIYYFKHVRLASQCVSMCQCQYRQTCMLTIHVAGVERGY